MNVITGVTAACLGFAGSLFLTKWTRLQEYGSAAWKLNWPNEAIEVLDRRKRRYFVLAMTSATAVLIIFVVTDDQPRAPGTIIAAVGAVSLVVSYALNLWWVRRWRCNPGNPRLPGRYW